MGVIFACYTVTQGKGTSTTGRGRMHNVIMMGLSCLAMAFVLFAAAPLEFDPDPILQGIVWLGFGGWCFGIVWSDKNERERAKRERSGG